MDFVKRSIPPSARSLARSLSSRPEEGWGGGEMGSRTSEEGGARIYEPLDGQRSDTRLPVTESLLSAYTRRGADTMGRLQVHPVRYIKHEDGGGSVCEQDTWKNHHHVDFHSSPNPPLPFLSPPNVAGDPQWWWQPPSQFYLSNSARSRFASGIRG